VLGRPAMSEQKPNYPEILGFNTNN
jgi:hypothetical protein